MNSIKRWYLRILSIDDIHGYYPRIISMEKWSSPRLHINAIFQNLGFSNLLTNRWSLKLCWQSDIKTYLPMLFDPKHQHLLFVLVTQDKARLVVIFQTSVSDAAFCVVFSVISKPSKANVKLYFSIIKQAFVFVFTTEQSLYSKSSPGDPPDRKQKRIQTFFQIFWYVSVLTGYH